jgi:hypothetical protein
MLEMLTGGALFAAGSAATYLYFRFAPSKALTPIEPSPEPICGCEHHLSLHDPTNGGCSGKAREGLKYTNGRMTNWNWIPCPCKQYVGPQPLTTIYAPEITGE